MRQSAGGMAVVLACATALFAAPALAAKTTRATKVEAPKRAVTVATVDAVQFPAWLEREGMKKPLALGMELRDGDVVRTAAGARAYVTLADGSRVKLAESAQLTIHSKSLKPKSLFRGAVNLAEGAFRVTTALLRKSKKNELMVRVGTATIGIRGTDLWGRSNRDGDLVALLEGKIDVTRAGQTVALDKKMTYFEAPRGQAGEVKTLDGETFKSMARQTEILPGDGAARARGMWRIVAGTHDNEDMALELYDQLREAGFAARIWPQQGYDLTGAPPWYYEVMVMGFPSEADAKAAAARLKASTGLDAKSVRLTTASDMRSMQSMVR